MKWIITGLIVLGLLAASASALLLASFRAGLLSRNAPAAEATVESTSVEIVVAAVDLPPWTRVGGSAIEMKAVPESAVPEGATVNAVQVVGRMVTVQLVEGQPILSRHLASDDDQINLIGTVPKGGRAINIAISGDTGLVGLLYPGCLVDVVASFGIPASLGALSGEIATVTLLQNISVLKVGSRSIVSGKDKSGDQTNISGQRRYVVTLLVDQKQAELLQLATVHGTINLTVRNPLDEELTETGGVLLSGLSKEFTRQFASTISPDALPFSAMRAPSGDEAGNEEPAADPAPDGEAASAAEEGAAVLFPMWTTKVYRGSKGVEVVEFAAEADKEPTDAVAEGPPPTEPGK